MNNSSNFLENFDFENFEIYENFWNLKVALRCRVPLFVWERKSEMDEPNKGNHPLLFSPLPLALSFIYTPHHFHISFAHSLNFVTRRDSSSSLSLSLLSSFLPPSLSLLPFFPILLSIFFLENSRTNPPPHSEGRASRGWAVAQEAQGGVRFSHQSMLSF